MKSSLQANMTTLINSMLNAGIGNKKAPEIKKVLNLNYNSFNDTIYIETENKYFVFECKDGLFIIISEFDKTNDQKQYKGGLF